MESNAPLYAGPDEPQPAGPLPWVPGKATPGKVDLREGWPREAVAQAGGYDCTSVALTAAVEYLAWKWKGSTARLSSLFLHHRTNRTFKDDSPTNEISTTLRVLQEFGVCSLEVLPDAKASELEKLPLGEWPAALVNEAAAHRIGQHRKLEQHRDELRDRLAHGFPIVFNFMLFTPSYWEWNLKPRLTTLPIPGKGDQAAQLHTALIMGYNESGFLIRNSEGPNWKMEGHFWMPDEFILNPEYARNFYMITELAGSQSGSGGAESPAAQGI